MLKNTKKSHILVICSLFVLFFCASCVKNCEIAPDLEQIGESALKNKQNLSETELRSVKGRCNF
jgi:hypothetical protein